MALADIVMRIADDASREAAGLVAEVRHAAEQTIAEAGARAAAERERIVREAHEQAELATRTKLARARIAARDRSLAAKRELVERAIAETVARLEALPDAEYAALIAREVAASARGGERVLVAGGEADRLAASLEAALAEAEAQSRANKGKKTTTTTNQES